VSPTLEVDTQSLSVLPSRLDSPISPSIASSGPFPVGVEEICLSEKV